MAINQPAARRPQNPPPAALTAALTAITNTGIMRALRPLPRVWGLSLQWVPGSGKASGVYRGSALMPGNGSLAAVCIVRVGRRPLYGVCVGRGPATRQLY